MKIVHLHIACRAVSALTALSLQQDYDLSKGESRESTTAHGLVFLDQIRRTADKRYTHCSRRNCSFKLTVSQKWPSRRHML